MAANKKSSGKIFNNAKRWPEGFAPWMAENKKATKLLLDLGFKKKIINEFIKSIKKNYIDDDCQDMKEIMQLKIPRRMLN